MWLASLIVASQISLDRAAPLSHWSASVSGLPLPILRSIHLDFLLAIEHKCNPSDSYPRFLEGLENWAGWLTETRQVARMCNAVSAAQKLGICESIRKGLERCRTELWALVERRESEA